MHKYPVLLRHMHALPLGRILRVLYIVAAAGERAVV
jgi:hypothetical protein